LKNGGDSDSDDDDSWIISYYNRTQIKVDFFTCLLVCYDGFMVPYKNSFGSTIFAQSQTAF